MLPDWLKSLADDPRHYAEVALSSDSPHRLGVRLFFEQIDSLECLDVPVGLVHLARELQQGFNLVPGHWLRVVVEGGEVVRLALNYEIPGPNYYPISTLRVFLRRYGCPPPPQLEQALKPALELPETRWGFSLDWGQQGGTRPRIFGRVPFSLLAPVCEALVGASLDSLLEALSRFPPSPWCYLTFSPSESQVLSVDLEEISLQQLDLPLSDWPRLPEPMLCPYAKFRNGRQTAYLPWPAFAAWWLPAPSQQVFLQRARDYYNSRQDDYLQHLGTTWQAGYWGSQGSKASNLELAARARIAPSMRILDAGCGVGGPALDIARAYPDVHVDGLNLCQRQLEHARAAVEESGLQARVKLHQGDFHCLPFQDGCFQRVLYLETSGYAYDRRALFREAYRVLQDGGMVYIKDVFRRPGPLRASQWTELNQFDRLYAQRTPTLEETLAALVESGFEIEEWADITGQTSMEHYHLAMGDARQPTSFGLAHGLTFRDLPLYFADLLAVKPPATPG